MSVGEQIKRYRTASGITASELARRADVSKSYLSTIESGVKDKPSAPILLRIAKVLGVSTDDLLSEQPPLARCKHWSVQWKERPGGDIECMSCGHTWSIASGPTFDEVRAHFEQSPVFEGQRRGAILDSLAFLSRPFAGLEATE